MQDLAGELRVDNFISPADVSVATTVSTNSNTYRSMSKYRKGLVVITAYLSNGNTAIGQLTCASDSSGTGKTNVSGKTVTLTGLTAARNQVGSIEFDDSDLDLANNKYYVGVDITTNQNGDDIAAVLIRGAARYFEGSSMRV